MLCVCLPSGQATAGFLCFLIWQKLWPDFSLTITCMYSLASAADWILFFRAQAVVLVRTT